MRRVDQPVSVQVQNSRPVQISWGGEVLTVENLIKCWVHQTGWWNPGGGERRVYYRLEVGHGTVDVYRLDGEWILARIVD